LIKKGGGKGKTVLLLFILLFSFEFLNRNLGRGLLKLFCSSARGRRDELAMYLLRFGQSVRSGIPFRTNYRKEEWWIEGNEVAVVSIVGKWDFWFGKIRKEWARASGFIMARVICRFEQSRMGDIGSPG
jgi:hypothetical protein